MVPERSRILSLATVSTALFVGMLVGCAAQAEIVSLTTRPGVSVEVRIVQPEDAIAVALIFAGGPGRLRTSSSGFALASLNLFVSKGIMIALIDAPSDQTRFRGGMHPSFRLSPNHVSDIDAVVSMLKQEINLPLWVVGISLGSRSAAYYAVRRHRDIDGVVLLSSPTNPPNGRSVAEFGLETITVPLFAVAHADDGCLGTPPAGARRIADAATSSPNAKVQIFTGGLDEGRHPCRPRTHHTFYGIEDEVVSAIAQFIKTNSK